MKQTNHPMRIRESRDHREVATGLPFLRAGARGVSVTKSTQKRKVIKSNAEPLRNAACSQVWLRRRCREEAPGAAHSQPRLKHAEICRYFFFRRRAETEYEADGGWPPNIPCSALSRKRRCMFVVKAMQKNMLECAAMLPQVERFCAEPVLSRAPDGRGEGGAIPLVRG